MYTWEPLRRAAGTSRSGSEPCSGLFAIPAQAGRKRQGLNDSPGSPRSRGADGKTKLIISLRSCTTREDPRAWAWPGTHVFFGRIVIWLWDEDWICGEAVVTMAVGRARRPDNARDDGALFIRVRPARPSSKPRWSRAWRKAMTASKSFWNRDRFGRTLYVPILHSRSKNSGVFSRAQKASRS
jgi:hypothetical protein